MYYSHSFQDETFDFFASFLREAIAGNVNYRELVEPIIQDVYYFVNGQRSIYNISRSNFDVVVYLAQNDSEYFKGINPDDISQNDYNHILNVISSQREVAFI